MIKKILILVFSTLFLINLAFADEIKEEKSIPNPLLELVQWTQKQNVGLTCFYDIDKKEYLLGAKWQFFKSEHDWLMAGLFATEKPSIGVAIGFNLGKLIEKIKGQPMVYLRYLEVGYAGTWLLEDGKYVDGLYTNVIKIEF